MLSDPRSPETGSRRTATARRPSVLAARRSFLLLAPALVAAHGARSSPPEAATLLVAGPDEGMAAQWAQRAGAGLARALTQAAAVRLQTVGASDGIAAANRFATTAAPDGRMLLAFSPTAAMARAQGDSRVRFDPSVWLPVCGAGHSAALVGMGPAPRTGTLRLGLPGPDAPETAMLFALDLLGVGAAPVFGLGPAQAEAALAQGAVEAIVLGGPALPERAAALGAQPWLAAEEFRGGRDPALPEVPVLSEHVGADRASALAACRLGLAAARLRGLVVLPALTPGDVVAAWRQAGQRWGEETQRDPLAADSRPLATVEAAAGLAALCPNAEAVRAYRDWLGRRLSWRAA